MSGSRSKTVRHIGGTDSLLNLNTLQQLCESEGISFHELPERAGKILGYSPSTLKPALNFLRRTKVLQISSKGNATFDQELQQLDYDSVAYRHRIADLFDKHIIGFYDILFFLLAAPAPIGRISTFVIHHYDVNWTSTTQTKFRVDWLRSLGFVEMISGSRHYQLTDWGVEYLLDRNTTETPHPRQIYDNLSDFGFYQVETETLNLTIPDEEALFYHQKIRASDRKVIENQLSTDLRSSIFLLVKDDTYRGFGNIHTRNGESTLAFRTFDKESEVELQASQKSTVWRIDPEVAEKIFRGGSQLYQTVIDNESEYGPLPKTDSLNAHYLENTVTHAANSERLTKDQRSRSTDEEEFPNRFTTAELSDKLAGDKREAEWDGGIETTYDDYEYEVAPFRDGEQEELALTGLHYENENGLIDQILTALRCGDHIILVGPPGTGKSELARQVTEHFVNDQYSMVTATADWSTFDTIGGYRPDGVDKLQFHAGVFLSRFQTSTNDPQNEWLIIDEINRADIDKAFGSLFSAIVGESVETPFSSPRDDPIEILGPTDGDKLVSEARYHIPPDWRLIATMNTYDKTSLYEMSYAFMRRFAFIHVDPPSEITEELVQTYAQTWDVDDTAPVRAITDIWEVIQQERTLGPALFERVFTYLAESESDDLTRPLTMYVLPQLEGLATQRIVEIVSALGQLERPVLAEQQLFRFCSDYFGISADRFERDE